MNQLAVIHIARKRLALDDEAYRAVLARVTGKTSSRDMTEAERGAVIDELRRLGFSDEKPSSGARKPLVGKYASKLQALWISGWHLGVVRDRSDEALTSFVKRQTGLDHIRFLHYADDAARAIEALKGWLAREARVDWRADREAPVWMQSDQARIAVALIRRAEALGLFTPGLADAARLEGVAGRPVALFTSRDWVKVHKALGASIRKELARRSRQGEAPPQDEGASARGEGIDANKEGGE